MKPSLFPLWPTGLLSVLTTIFVLADLDLNAEMTAEVARIAEHAAYSHLVV